MSLYSLDRNFVYQYCLKISSHLPDVLTKMENSVAKLN